MAAKNNPKVSILLLCDDHHGHANTVFDHISALINLSKFKVYLYNPRRLKHNTLLNLNEFDVVVIHYSIPIIHESYLAVDLREKIHQFQGLKIQFIQDDYRQVNEYTEMMRHLGIHILFTPYPQEKIPFIYNETRLPGVTKITTLTGYVPDRYIDLKSAPLKSRPVDVGYRGRNLPYWLGKFSQEKAWIGEGFLEHASQYGMKFDIAWREENRIYGKGWDRFIGSCKAMLGTESGASITDFDGSAEKKTKEYLKDHPGADFREVYEQILKDYEGNLIENTISPRVFECIAHRTAMILFPGKYSGIIQPWVHYIPFEKDFSNIDQVISKLRDVKFLKAMTERAHTDIIASGQYSYRAMVAEFDDIIIRHLKPCIDIRRSKIRFGLAQAERQFGIFFLNLRILAGRLFRYLRVLAGRLFRFMIPILKKHLP